MAKYFGVIGYIIYVETRPGIWEEELVEHNYYGDFIRNSRRLENQQDNINDNISISNQISIVADPFAYENFGNMKYLEYMGTKWRITSVEVKFPRLILDIGGIYNGKTET